MRLNILLVTAALLTPMIATGPAEAKLKCKDVKGRWQVCGDAKPFKKFVIGVGIRFSKKPLGLSANPPQSTGPAKLAPKRRK